MKNMKMTMMVGGAGLLGYWYLKKHPEKVKMLKEMGKAASHMMNDKLDTE